MFKLLILLTSFVFVQAKRPFLPQDLVSFTRLSTFATAEHGALLTASSYNLSNNHVSTQLEYFNFKSNQQTILAFEVSEPFWFSNSIVGGIQTIQGVSQIVYAKFINGATKLDFKPLTNYPVSVSNVKFNSKASLLAFTASVYRDGSIENAKPKKKFDSGTIYNKLFVRHWDRYIDPDVFSQLFTVKVSVSDSDVKLVSTPINLMKHTELETPVAPDNDANDFDISPDGTEIAFTSRVPVRSQAWETNTDVYIVPTDGSKMPVPISAHNLGYDKHPKYSLDGSFIAWLQMPTPQYEADRNRIALYGRAFSASSLVSLKADDDEEWDRSPESLTWTDSHLVITAQELGQMKLFKVDIADGLVLPLVTEGAIKHVSFVKNEGLVFTKSSLKEPSNLYLLTHSNKLHQKTFYNREKLQDIQLSEPEEFWFTGAKRPVHGFLLKPYGFKPTEKYPLAFLIHGGPESAWNNDWGLRWNQQVFAGAGYVVITINPTGSTGYGSQFTKDIMNEWGSLPFVDLMNGLDYAISQFKYIDSGRMCALGASYGGYMINWINGHTDRFKCLVNHDGIFDTTGSYYNSDELWFPEMEFGGLPFGNDRTTYLKFSPMRFVENWKTPTLVIHSELDYRLPVTEGLSTFTALQRRGIESKFLYFPDENHWVLKHANSLRWNEEVLDWLNSWNELEESKKEKEILKNQKN